MFPIPLRQNTESLDESRRTAAANAYQSRAFAFSSDVLANAHSPEMVEALVAFETAGGRDRPSEALASLSPQDQLRIRNYYLARVVRYDNNYYQYRNGYIEEDRYQSVDARVIELDTPIWKAFDFVQTPEMEEEMNRLQEQ